MCSDHGDKVRVFKMSFFYVNIDGHSAPMLSGITSPRLVYIVDGPLQMIFHLISFKFYHKMSKTKMSIAYV